MINPIAAFGEGGSIQEYLEKITDEEQIQTIDEQDSFGLTALHEGSTISYYN